MRYLQLFFIPLLLISCNSNQPDSKQPDKVTDTVISNTVLVEPSTIIKTFTDKIDTIHIGKQVIELMPVDKNVFEDLGVVEFNEPDDEIINDTANVKRDFLRLTFKLKNGTDTTLTNDTTELWSKYRDYQYLDNYDFMDYWLLSVTYYEGFSYMLLDKETGEDITIWSIPIFSPNREKFVCNSFDMEAGYNPNGLQYFRIENGKLVNDWNKELSDWGPSKVKWLNDTLIIVEQKIMNPESDEFYSTEYKSLIIK
jgi:hypothetical protein